MYDIIIMLNGEEFVLEYGEEITEELAEETVEKLRSCDHVNYIHTNRGILAFSCKHNQSVYFLARKKEQL